MSVESIVDLRADASPRSLSVFAAAETKVGSTNPFDVSKGSADKGSVIAFVYGTDKGSIHYRTYAAPGPSSNQGGLSAQLNLTSSLTTPPSNRISSPLGANSSNQRSTNLPRAYYPVDLGSLGGPVVSCIKLGISQSNSTYLLLLVDDNRGTSATQPGAYSAIIVALTAGNFHIVVPSGNLPRMSCATFHSMTGLVYGAGRSIQVLRPETWEEEVKRGSRYAASRSKRLIFGNNICPAPGVRTGQDGMELTANGKVVIAVVGNTFHAIVGQEADERQQTGTEAASEHIKLISFSQSSQVHPVIALDLRDESLDADWSSLFLASGRECAVVDINYGPPSAPTLSASKPRNGIVTLASPIRAAAACWPWIVVLTNDGLVSVRPPSCLSVTLRTVEVGQRPNDFFVLRTLRNESGAPWIAALAYSGESKILQCRPDTAQDLADRLMRHAIDAFGANGFPRSEVAESVGASVTAASYVGPEPSQQARMLLKQYLEALLGMTDFEGNPSSGWPSELGTGKLRQGSFGSTKEKGRGYRPTMLSAESPGHLIAATALLCLVCSKISPPNPAVANRAAKSCADKLGVVFRERGDLSESASQVCVLVADKILREASANFSLLSGSASPSPLQHSNRGSNSTNNSTFIEASVWLLRSAGKHEQAIDVAYTRLLQQGQQVQPEEESSSVGGKGTWSHIKYESYTATHLSDLWCSGKSEGRDLVLRSPATFRLLANNPRLGLSVFTATHPQNEDQWRKMAAKDDPLVNADYVYDVLKLLKSVNPALPYDQERSESVSDTTLPLGSGRALAVAFLESAIGIYSGRPSERNDLVSGAVDSKVSEHIANFHDELSFLLLEGVIAEKSEDGAQASDTSLGEVYRKKLQKLLKSPLARIRSERFLATLPPSFLQEKALMLGRVGRHEDALRILYQELDSLELALEYCDDRFEQQRILRDRRYQQQQQQLTSGIDQSFDMSTLISGEDNAYLPLVRVALESKDQERGIRAAIQILALRRNAIDRAAALRLLPSGIPVSAVARPFLIPALVDSESQERRLTVVAALMRARYLRLKEELTVAQLRSQASLQAVPQLRSLNLGEPLYSSKAVRARTNAAASATMPDVMIIKHFFPRNVVIQAKVTNNTGGDSSDYRLSTHGRVGRTFTEIAFVVAESSEEAIQPLFIVPIKVLPQKLSGSAWCVLEAAPARMDGAVVQLTCELRYTVQSVESAGLIGSPGSGVAGRTFVEELQDLEVHAAHFS
ncbi:hypothetical protein FisN_23Hh242 [Fistulifera solaris]|uniref:Coatomer gamma subunit appendage Ig-like subdomain domain-containing protein n=1 Tax=Fistulifera solaris TaxID=1519565 RepID=A0A1Z5JX06_FISSO|nr:hypothetical protein FisN_23Hh242 [Fistulifera solaris]|eukprot:GAX18348.1 hypothetical protein FisN_23Hh242 [Fistulifera solaris]